MSTEATTDSVEREAKLAVGSDAVLDELARRAELGAGLALEGAARAVVDDEYLDTKDYALLRSGWSLRVRTKNGARTMTAKAISRAAGAVHARREVEGPLVDGADARDGDSWPSGIPDVVRTALRARGHGKRAEIVSIARLSQVRLTRIVHGLAGASDASAGEAPSTAPPTSADNGVAATAAAGAAAPALPAGPVAELSLDRVEIRHPDPDAAPGDAAVAAFRAVELEALPGADDAAFQRTVGALLASVDGQPEPGGKLERALAVLAEHLPGDPVDRQGVLPDQPMAEAGRLIWRRQLMAMLVNEAGARDGSDIEYVHDMRVATRRARSMAALFGDFWDEDEVAPLLAGLKKTARTLGDVRDLDVALDDLAEHRAAMSPEDAEGLAPLADHWAWARDDARARLFKWLDSRSYRRFVAAMDRFTRTPGRGVRAPSPGPEIPATQVRHVLPVRILAAFMAVRAYETDIGRPGLPVETLHALRIDAKRLRYALEPVPHLLGEDGAATVKMLKRLQDHLGRMNDAAVAGERLRAADAEGLGSPALTSYIAEQDARLAERVATLGEVWEPFVAEPVRTRLLAALARM